MRLVLFVSPVLKRRKQILERLSHKVMNRWDWMEIPVPPMNWLDGCLETLGLRSFDPCSLQSGGGTEGWTQFLVGGLRRNDGGGAAGSRTLEHHGAPLSVLGLSGMWLALPVTRGGRGGTAQWVPTCRGCYCTTIRCPFGAAISAEAHVHFLPRTLKGP